MSLTIPLIKENTITRIGVYMRKKVTYAKESKISIRVVVDSHSYWSENFTRMDVKMRKEAHIENDLKFQYVWPFTATLSEGLKVWKWMYIWWIKHIYKKLCNVRKSGR